MKASEQLVMKLTHYFITQENYSPVVVHGVKNEIWLENLDAEYKIIRINSNYIHNDEQLKIDYFKVKSIVRHIKKKTLSLRFKSLNINVDVRDSVEEIKDKNITTVFAKKVKDMKSVFPEIDKSLLKSNDKLDLFYQATKEIEEKTKRENKVYENIFKEKPILITYILIGINIFVFAIIHVFDILLNNQNMFYLLANSSLHVKAGEVWRLLTSAFVHIEIFHLFVNMYSLYILGTQVEKFIGRKKFLSIYLVSAILGSMFSVLIGGNTVSIGASGAIFGIAGALLYFGLHFRLYLSHSLKSQIIPVIIFNLVLGFLIPGIDTAAHVGGLLGGYLMTSALGISVKENKQEKRNSFISLILIFAFVIYLIFN